MKKDKTIDDTRLWDSYRGKIRSRNGGWVVGQGVFCHDFDMMEELVGKVSYFQFLVLNATGRLPERRYADWLEAIFICMSWPDPRIWCNQVGALGGTLRTSVQAATAAGLQTAISRVYGPQTLIEGMAFLQRALKKHLSGVSVPQIVAEECAGQGGKPTITGFARPVAKGDERIPAMEEVAKRLGLAVGEHLALAYQIEQCLMAEFNEGLNLTGYTAAVMADEGFSPEQARQICAALVASGITACYIDAAARPGLTFLPLRCDDLDYRGKGPRPLPAR